MAQNHSHSHFNLKVAKGEHTYFFMLEQSAIDFIHQAGPTNSLPTVLSFLESCIKNGSINMNINELYNEKTKLFISIPERDLNYEVPINTSSSSHCNIESISEHTFKDSSNNNSYDKNDKVISMQNQNATALWTDGITKFMLERYAKWMNFVGPMKKFKKKVDMWKQIATDIDNELGVKFSFIQVENRYKTVCKRKKLVINNNRQTGASRMDDSFESEWNQIANNDDSILPEVLRNTTNVVVNKKDFENKPKKSKQESPQMLLLQFLKEKDIQKERRHQEKMELIKKLFET